MPQAIFQQGVNDYAETSDTMLREYHPDQDYASATSLSVDSSDPSGNNDHILLRFADLFGTGPGQIPSDAIITSATLTLETNNKGGGASLHRMLTPWSDTATYSSLDGGIQADDTEAAATADLVTGWVSKGSRDFDVTTSVQAWAHGADNYGWAFLPSSSNGWDFYSSESDQAPVLTVDYTLSPETPGDTNVAPVATNDAYSTSQDTALIIAGATLLTNDTDADGDPLAITGVTPSASTHGSVSYDALKEEVTFIPDAGYIGPASWDYQIADGNGGTGQATVTVAVTVAAPANQAPWRPQTATSPLPISPSRSAHRVYWPMMRTRTAMRCKRPSSQIRPTAHWD